MERYAQSIKDSGVALANVRETRTSLQRLVDKLDSLETGFDRIAERSRTSIMSFPFIAEVDLTFTCSSLNITVGPITEALWVGSWHLECLLN
jgi:hypothetical protein